MNKLILAAAALAGIAAVPGATAQTPISVPRFQGIELRGGGEMIIRHGAQQRVTLLSGDRALAGFDVDRQGTLVVRPCRTSCRNQRLRVEVVTPRLEAVAIRGGGTIRAEGGFPAADDVAVAVHGGGTIDTRAVPRRDVAAAVVGGGLIRVAAQRSLAASITGGGAIRYLGDPQKSVAIHGGGTVTPDR
ncbi:MAG TPA: DUF2807 domain-containing protein [Allosphingosinicella sp.]|jgi:hypothetical protein